MCIRSAAVQRGLTLVEQVVFIVVVAVAVTGVLAALTVSTRGSADPMVQKQALAIAEALLEEVQLQPFTYCDPDDASAATAVSTTDCTGGVDGANDEGKSPLGPEAGEDRYSTTTPFDNVSDFTGFDTATASQTGIRNMDGTLISGLDGYQATVSVARQALGTIDLDANNRPQSLLVTVTVTGPANTTVILQGYRTRYAPNALP